MSSLFPALMREVVQSRPPACPSDLPTEGNETNELALTLLKHLNLRVSSWPRVG